MTAPKNDCAFDLDTALAAADRWAGREEHHKKFEEAVRKKQYSELDTPERCAARANRLLGKLRETAAGGLVAAAVDVVEMAAPGFAEAFGPESVGAEVTPETVSDVGLERVIGMTRDFQFVESLYKALDASKSVGRIVNRPPTGRVCFGTGFMASPRLLMTNHHVLPNAETAARSTVEFDYQRDRFGVDLQAQSFKLDPDTFFLNDKELDFALVALSPNGARRPLADFLWCPLLPDAGKIVAPEPINIIQHPLGERKQVVMRENRLIDALDGTGLFYHYEADTEPGSSGSPVFNDQWEVVALHHSGVPRRNRNKEVLDVDGNVWRKGDDPSRIDWVANEGVRVSKLVEFISKARVTGAARGLLKEFLEAKPPPVERKPAEEDSPRRDRAGERSTERKRDDPEGENSGPPETTSRFQNGARSVTLTVPLNITFSLGGSGEGLSAVIDTGAGGGAGPDESLLEKIEIDPDYTNRPGFDREFLDFEVPFPQLTSATRPKAFALPGVSGDGRFELKYYHYSVLFNKERKLAFVAGVNFDPTARFKHKREPKDKWFFDPRVKPITVQAGDDLYAENPLDRGHLVRRADAGWGATKKEAKLANDDTFHFTNCSPQHAITNQGKTRIKDRGRVIVAPQGLKLWGKLEEHVAAQGKAGRRKLCIFNGPVFRTSDEEYRGVKIPREFWKVVVFPNDAGEPGAATFVLTQADLIEDLKEEFEVGEYKAVQVRIQDLEARTKLDFGPFSGWDVLEREEAEESFTGDLPAVVLNSVTDIVL